jgi:hypothetical protein
MTSAVKDVDILFYAIEPNIEKTGDAHAITGFESLLNKIFQQVFS